MKAKLIILAVFMGLSTLLMAQPKEGMPKKPMQKEAWKMQMQKKQHNPGAMLNLSNEQKEAFKQSMLALQKEMKPIRNELGEVMAHQRTLVTADQPDLKAIDKNLDKIGELKTKMEKIQTKNRLAMRAQLTPEQQMKFDMMKGKMRQQRAPQGANHFRGRI